MKKNVFKRALCLACCLSLTLGLFVYKPPKADAYFGTAAASLGGAIIGTIVRATTAYYTVEDVTENDFLMSIGRLIDDYISDNSETITETSDSFAEVVGSGVTRRSDGLVQLSSKAGQYSAEFLNWLQNRKLTVDAPTYKYTGRRLLPLYEGGYLSVAYVGPVWDEDGDNAEYYPNMISPSPTWFDLNEEVLLVSTSGDIRSLEAHTDDDRPGYICITQPLAVDRAFHPSVWGYSDDVSCVAWQPAVFGTEYLGYVFKFSDGSLRSVIVTKKSLKAYLGTTSFSGTSVSVTSLDSYQTVPVDIDTTQAVVLSPNIDDFNLDDTTLATSALVSSLISGTAVPTVTVDTAQDVPGVDTDTDIVVPGADAELLDWTKYIAQNLAAIPQAIADAIAAIFVPDANLINDITGAFNAKFGFVETLKTVGDDLLGMTAATEPPAVWLHLEDAEGNVRYGDAVLALDLTWYSRYKADVDRILGGFLWLGYLWLLFKRAPNILAGMGLTEAPPARSSDDGR